MGVPVALYASLNENEPVVNTLEEAIEFLLPTETDVPAIKPFLEDRG